LETMKLPPDLVAMPKSRTWPYGRHPPELWFLH
jgi:hypothetical protein